MQKQCAICGEMYEARSAEKTCGKYECKDKLYKERKERQYAKYRTGRPTGRPKKEIIEKPRLNKNDSLCWDCQNACGGCNWSRSLKSVEGWNVEVKKIQHKANGRTTFDESCRVISCPEYIPDEPRERK